MCVVEEESPNGVSHVRTRLVAVVRCAVSAAMSCVMVSSTANMKGRLWGWTWGGSGAQKAGDHGGELVKFDEEPVVSVVGVHGF